MFNHAHVDGIATHAQLIVNDVLHDVSLLDLPETQTRVSQSDILEIVFLRTSDVFSALDVVTPSLLNHKRLFKTGNV